MILDSVFLFILHWCKMYILPYAVLEGHNLWLLAAISSTKQRLHFIQPVDVLKCLFDCPFQVALYGSYVSAAKLTSSSSFCFWFLIECEGCFLWHLRAVHHCFSPGSPDVEHSPVAYILAVVAHCDDQVMCAICVCFFCFFFGTDKNLVELPLHPAIGS